MEWRPSPEGIRDNLFSNVAWAFLAIVGTAVLTSWTWTWVRETVPPPLLIILGIVIYGFIVWTINQTRVLLRWWSEPQRPEMITHAVATDPTSMVLEDTIRKWLDDFHFKVQKVEQEGKHFCFVVQGASNNPIYIMRLIKEREQFLIFSGFINIGTDDQKKLESLVRQERVRILWELMTELSRQKITNRITFPRTVRVDTVVPVAELTQDKFIGRIDDIDHAINLTLIKFRLLLDFSLPLSGPPLPTVLSVEPEEPMTGREITPQNLTGSENQKDIAPEEAGSSE